MSVEKQTEESIIDEDQLKEEEVEVDVKLEEADNAAESTPVETQEDTKTDESVETKAETEEQEAEPSPSKQGKSKFQKRIDDLTKRQREAERQRDEYYSVAQKVLNENKELREQASKFGEFGSTEFENRIKSQVESAKEAFKRAYEEGDAEKIAQAQQQMMEATAQKSQVGQMKRVAENIGKQQQPELKAPPNTKAVEWASRNPWFNRDMVMTNVAYTIHDDIVRGGVQVDSDEYYDTLDSRLRKELPHKFSEEETDKPKETQKPVAQQPMVTPAGNQVANKSRKVRLTPSQVAVANRLGVSLEDYAKEFVALNN
tara:strand:- start:355 stop:1299 length:945 start_codon:yes stop_codon:yes gene_type:complete